MHGHKFTVANWPLLVKNHYVFSDGRPFWQLDLIFVEKYLNRPTPKVGKERNPNTP